MVVESPKQAPLKTNDLGLEVVSTIGPMQIHAMLWDSLATMKVHLENFFGVFSTNVVLQSMQS
jgi:hypothetical protein